MSILERLRARFGGRVTAVGTPSIPVGQHEELTEAEKFKREHGFSAATEPEQWTAEIAAHNRTIDAEYDAEIARRKVLLAEGRYTPRFYLTDFADDGTPIVSTEVNWHLELTLEPGRRLDLTKSAGVTPLAILSAEDVRAGWEAERLQQRAASIVTAKSLSPDALANSPRLVKDLVGDRAAILAAVHGNEQLADQLEAAALAYFSEVGIGVPPAGK